MSVTLAQALARFALPRLESRLLLMHVVPGLTHARLIGYADDVLEKEALEHFDHLATQRLQGVPIAYLLGTREFYGRDFLVSPDVLIPRPETEHLIDTVFSHYDRHHKVSVLDLGTGSGAIAVTLALECPQWKVHAVDLSAAALEVARRNASTLGAEVAFFQGSWFEPLPVNTQFDLIVSNPPYIAARDHHLDEGDVRFEPRMALTDEADGLDCYREILGKAHPFMASGAWLMVEHGYDQGELLRDFFAGNDLISVQTVKDLAGLDRLTIGQRQ